MNLEEILKPQEKKIADFIKKHQLLEPKSRLLIAVSGGKDSVAVTHILKDLGYIIEIAHVNFCLRADESDEDAAFVKALANSLEVPFHEMVFDTMSLSKKGESTQMTARRLRYAWFEQLAADRNINQVITAHSANDNAETLLYNLTKGTGLNGMVGIPIKNGLYVRPMLSLSTTEVREYLEKRQIKFREDSSNASDKYSRNKIRQHVMPALETINPSLVQSLTSHSERFSSINKGYRAMVERLKSVYWKANEYGYWVFKISQLAHITEPENLFVEWLMPLGFDPEQVKSFQKEGLSGAAIYADDYELIRTSHSLLLGKKHTIQPVHQTFEVGSIGSLSTDFGSLSWETTNRYPLREVKHPNCAFLNIEYLPNTLTLCHPEKGARFRPFGMKSGSQLISDFMTNQKMTLPQKRETLLLKTDEKVVWVVGTRISNDFRVPSFSGDCLRFIWTKKTKSAFPFI